MRVFRVQHTAEVSEGLETRVSRRALPNLEEPIDHPGRLLPGGFLLAEMLAARFRQPTDFHAPATFGFTPCRGDPAGLFELDERGVERTLVEHKLMAADSFETAGESIPVKRSERLQRLEHDQTQRPAEDVLVGYHRLVTYSSSCRLSTDRRPRRRYAPVNLREEPLVPKTDLMQGRVFVSSSEARH